jgi:hypothetical protein
VTVVRAAAGPAARPPLWLVLATAAMALVLLAMSVTETSFQGQFLIDQGESLSLVGLAFILFAGLYLHRHGRLSASLPLVVPWLLYPVITQGDQMIDNLSITWMRIVVHVLLGAIFAAPVAVIVVAVKWASAPSRRTLTWIALALLAAELWIAYAFLGLLMIGTQLAMIGVVLFVGLRSLRADPPSPLRGFHLRASRFGGQVGEAGSFLVLVIGVIVSGALYLGFKNRPGAYQGSPSHYMDPSQPGGGYQSSVTVPTGEAARPAEADNVRRTLVAYADSLQRLLDGYYLLDRNYNYHFHNELFLRATPLAPNYRAAGLALITDAARRREQADAAANALALADGDPWKALIADLRAFVAFNFERATTLERMSAVFEQTKAGLQHATHIYEGEGKYLGVQLAALLDRHRAVVGAPAVRDVVADFTAGCQAIHDRYANRIVGF